MRNNTIDLHLNKRSALLLSVTYIVVLLTISLVVVFTTSDRCAQLFCLLKSDYLYSATQVPASDTDDYYQFDAGITFKLSDDSDKGVNVDVLMQTDNSVYTDSVCWNVDELDVYEIAVSENLAREYNLAIGDILFSKHIVDGETYQYRVVELLPDMMCVRVLDNRQHSDGVIVMGFDERYVDNISSLHLIFTSESVNDIYGASDGTLSDIVYRNDEIIDMCIRIAPYALIYILLSVLATVIYVFFINRALSYNTRRLVMLGWEKKCINASYYKYVLGIGFVSMIVVSFIVCVSCVIFEMTVLTVCLCLIALVLEALAILVLSTVCIKRIWRS